MKIFIGGMEGFGYNLVIFYEEETLFLDYYFLERMSGVPGSFAE